MFTVVVERAPLALKLPVEVIDEFCRYLSRDDLRNFALVYKDARPGAHRALFRDVFVKINLDSFDKLRSISEEQTLSRYVRKLEYDARIIESGEDDDITFENWMEYVAGTGLGVIMDRSKATKRFFLDFICDNKLQEHFRAYCRYLHGQNFLRRGKLTKHLLVSALTTFPHLSSVSYSALQYVWHGPLYPDVAHEYTPDWDDLGFMAKKILQNSYGRQLHEDDKDDEFMAFWESCRETGVPQELTELRLSDIDPYRLWKRNPCDFLGIFKGLTGLCSLTISLSSPSERKQWPKRFNLTQILASQLSLHTLELSFDTNYGDDHTRLSQLIKPGQHWESLRDISLNGIIAKYPDLVSLLGAHASTLRYLSLSEIKLARFRPPIESPPYWIDFFVFLNQSMTLDSFLVGGVLENDLTKEVWDASPDCSEHITSQGLCLKQEIMRYVLRQGELPFKSPTQDDDPELIDDEFEDYCKVGPWFSMADNCFLSLT
jgi:hypothetical protein